MCTAVFIFKKVINVTAYVYTVVFIFLNCLKLRLYKVAHALVWLLYEHLQLLENRFSASATVFYFIPKLSIHYRGATVIFCLYWKPWECWSYLLYNSLALRKIFKSKVGLCAILFTI
jgi:hypothetical protein